MTLTNIIPGGDRSNVKVRASIMEPGMIRFRCNYATVSKDGIITDRRAGRIHDTTDLSRAIQDGVDLSKHGVEFVSARCRSPGITGFERKRYRALCFFQ